MSLRPRYSLLALFLLTAAVAGGVKLWRGPHHVVDRSNPQMEDEYTYYRDWDGTKIVDGFRIRRYTADPSEPKITSTMFDYYRAGVLNQAHQMLLIIPASENQLSFSDEVKPMKFQEQPLSLQEQKDFDKTVEQEIMLLEKHGKKLLMHYRVVPE